MLYTVHGSERSKKRQTIKALVYFIAFVFLLRFQFSFLIVLILIIIFGEIGLFQAKSTLEIKKGELIFKNRFGTRRILNSEVVKLESIMDYDPEFYEMAVNCRSGQNEFCGDYVVFKLKIFLTNEDYFLYSINDKDKIAMLEKELAEANFLIHKLEKSSV